MSDGVRDELLELERKKTRQLRDDKGSIISSIKSDFEAEYPDFDFKVYVDNNVVTVHGVSDDTKIHVKGSVFSLGALKKDFRYKLFLRNISGRKKSIHKGTLVKVKQYPSYIGEVLEIIETTNEVVVLFKGSERVTKPVVVNKRDVAVYR